MASLTFLIEAISPVQMALSASLRPDGVFYDVSTGLYARIRSRGEEARRREYLSRLEIERESRVLEVSVGTGANLPLLPAGASLFGLDISGGMLRRCRRRARRNKLQLELFLGAAERTLEADAPKGTRTEARS